MNGHQINILKFSEKFSPIELYFNELHDRFIMLKNAGPITKQLVMIATLQDGSFI